MDERCGALREIQLGHIGVEQFAPPGVFTSGLYERFKVTIVDLRLHLLDCASCAQSMSEARAQLDHFDKGRLEVLYEAYSLIESAIEDRLQREQRLAEGTASDIWEIFYEESEESNDRNLKESIIESEGDRIFQERRQVVYLEAIKIQAVFALLLDRWLETVLPRTVRRIHRVGKSGIEDVHLDYDDSDADQWIALASGLVSLVGAGSAALRLLFRALYLREAFGQLLSDADLRRLLPQKVLALSGLTEQTAESSPAFPQRPVSKDLGVEIDWRKIWMHYSLLASLRADAISYQGIGLKSEIAPAPVEALFEKLEAIEEKQDSFLSGQTAMMDLLSDIGKAAGQLLDRYVRAPSEIKVRCEETIRAALGPVFDRLADQSRKFLLTAEYAYSELPADLDYSGAVLCLMKSFEVELKRVMRPFLPQMQRLADTDPEFHNGPLERKPLGPWKFVLERHRGELEPLLSERGLSCDGVLLAIGQVNLSKDAKHRASVDKAAATAFRTVFLGRPSVLGVLHPKP